MKYPLIICIITLILYCCDSKVGDYYFEFDQVEHYSTGIDEDELFASLNSTNLTPIQILQQELIINDTPEKLSDTLFVGELEKIGFSKNLIPKQKLNEINNIFRVKSHNQSMSMACMPVYRDLLIFRSKGKIVGVAKICFTCSQHLIIGTKSNTIGFGQSGDYNKLRKILN